MIRTYLHLDVLEGESDNLVRMFKQRQILEASVGIPGCRDAELTVSEDGRRAIVTATWDSFDAYDRWTSHSSRGVHSEKLSALLSLPITAETVGNRYTIAHCASSESETR